VRKRGSKIMGIRGGERVIVVVRIGRVDGKKYNEDVYE
jgi:hypothetical protein